MIIPDDVFMEVTRLGFDTAPFIYFVERHPVYLPIIRDIVIKIDQGTVQGYGSVITLTEVLVHPKRNGKIALEKNIVIFCKTVGILNSSRLMPISPTRLRNLGVAIT